MFGILKRVRSIIEQGLRVASNAIAHWTKPIAHAPTVAVVADLARSKPQLLAENLLLRQQLIVLSRSVKRPHFTRADRGLFVLLASKVQTWKEALLIVKPETVLRWHREGFRLFWKRKSGATSRDPKIPLETISLIKEMAANNRLWGAERIRGELLKVGIKVAKRTVQRYMHQARPRRPHGQTWTSFLRNHAKDIWACDFLQVHDVFFRPVFAFFVTELSSRQIVQVGVTRCPSDEWVAQQLRDAMPFWEVPQYLIRDNDAKYRSHFEAVAVGTGLENPDTRRERDLRTIARRCPARMPRPHPHRERRTPPPRSQSVCDVLQSLATASRHWPTRSRA